MFTRFREGAGFLEFSLAFRRSISQEPFANRVPMSDSFSFRRISKGKVSTLRRMQNAVYKCAFYDSLLLPLQDTTASMNFPCFRVMHQGSSRQWNMDDAGQPYMRCGRKWKQAKCMGGTCVHDKTRSRNHSPSKILQQIKFKISLSR